MRPEIFLALLLTLPASAPPSAAAPVLETPHFTFHSDFATNLEDALVFAAAARNREAPELFDAGPEAECFGAISAAARAGWNRVVDYYAEIVVPDAPGRTRERTVLRLDLAGVVPDEEWEGESRTWVDLGRAFRAAAAPAYGACRWPEQDKANRAWIDELAPRLAKHEEAIAGRLAEVYGTPWEGLPFRVDVVATADPTGAHTINLDPPGAHVLISSTDPRYREWAALEMVFHEAAHFLTGRGEPVPVAIATALEELKYRFNGDLTHWVNFYMTGEVVRRALEAAGEPEYTPFLYAQGLGEGGSFRPAIERAWPPYLDGERTLEEAAHDLVRALLEALRGSAAEED
jgi:hypothetical protein